MAKPGAKLDKTAEADARFQAARAAYLQSTLGIDAMQYLRSVGRAPTILATSMPQNLSGSYTPDLNFVAVNRDNDQSPTALRDTLAHEVTHAEDTARGAQLAGIAALGLPARTREEQRFLQANNAQSQSSLRRQINAVGAEFAGNAYRLSPGEALGWGVGRYGSPEPPRWFPQPPRQSTGHLDASMATENEIQRDLAMRAFLSRQPR